MNLKALICCMKTWGGVLGGSPTNEEPPTNNLLDLCPNENDTRS